jgi:5-methylcytosine-specific restriction protein A
MLARDATVCGVLMEGPHEVLQMGRRARTATPAQLRALAIRDGGCVIPGCGRPPDWCDAHHLVPWTRGGATDINDMRLVCRPHHTMIHLGLLDLPQRE